MPDPSPSYLKRRKLGWYVQVAVPRRLQESIGQAVVVRSLGTRDRAEANRRKHAAVADILASFDRADSRPAPGTPEGLLALAIQARQDVDQGAGDQANIEAGFDAEVDEYLDTQARRHGVNAEGHPKLPAGASATIRRAFKAITGDLARTLGHQVPAYIGEQRSRLTAQTIGDKERWLFAFLQWFGADRDGAEVTRKEAGRYVAEVIAKRTRAKGVALSPVTKGKELSSLRAFFEWLLVRGAIESNPFDRMASTIKASSKGKPAARRPWRPSELAKVMHGLDRADPLWSLVAIAAYTGMRREEVGELKVSSVDGQVLKVERGKTAAAVRRVPIHPAIAPLVKRLARTSTDGYLISGLLPGGPDRKRTWYVGKRFGLIIRKLGITDPLLDFHALRGTVITQLEDAGVPVGTVQLIVGHRREGMTLGVYSAGVSDRVKRKALALVSYGKGLDGYTAKAGASVTVRPSARARGKARGKAAARAV